MNVEHTDRLILEDAAGRFFCDEQQQRNLASNDIHGLLVSNGRSSAQFLQDAKEKLLRHELVSIFRTRG
jgi:hypothetical protein